LAPGAGDDGEGGARGAAVARAVGEAVVLAKQGGGTTGLTLAVEILAPAGDVGLWAVDIAEALARSGAGGAWLTFVERGAEAWHGFPPRNKQ